jgi:HEPN superfamily protein
MKGMTPDRLRQQIDDDLTWRQIELHDMRSAALGAAGTKRNALMRAGIAALYAHWEGFIKEAASRYADFVRQRKLTYNDLSLNYVALAVAMVRRQASALDEAERDRRIVDVLLNQRNTRACLPRSELIVVTKQNLNGKVLQSITANIGINYRPEYAAAEIPVINAFVELRNKIAHGENRDVDPAMFLRFFDNVPRLMELFRNEIDNAVDMKSYRRPTSPSQAAMGSKIP